MPWLIGIDEAGYGPNLGPLVMTSVACRVPEALVGADLWHVLRAAVRRSAEDKDGRLLIADSKVVYSAARGLAALETGTLAALALGTNGGPLSLAGFLDCVLWASAGDVAAEPWYTGQSLLPVAAAPAVCHAAAECLHGSSRRNDVAWTQVRSVVICPGRFNALLDRWGSKGAVLGHGLAELIRCNRNAAGGESLHFLVDKHGGRNHYAPMLQASFPDGLVVAHKEGAACSAYTVLGARQQVRLTFEPRADAGHFCVALASMVSKYLREVLMGEFNHFWRQQVPDLEPTAGYPGDAARFFLAIRPACERLQLPEDAVWRRR
jgi:hypothetical protein